MIRAVSVRSYAADRLGAGVQDVPGGRRRAGDPLEVDGAGLPRSRRLVVRRAAPCRAGCSPAARPGRTARRRAARRTCMPSRRRSRRPDPCTSIRAVRRVLHRIHVADRAGGAGELRQPCDVADRAGAVGCPVERRYARAVGELRGEVVDVDQAGVEVGVDEAHRRAAVLGGQHPRRHVAVVVNAGDQDLVALADPAGQRPRRVERQRGHVGAEDHLAGIAAEEPRPGRGAPLPAPRRWRRRSRTARPGSRSTAGSTRVTAVITEPCTWVPPGLSR